MSNSIEGPVNAHQNLLRGLEQAVKKKRDDQALLALEAFSGHFPGSDHLNVMLTRSFERFGKPLVAVVAENGLSVTLHRLLTLGADPDRPVLPGPFGFGDAAPGRQEDDKHETALSLAVTSNSPGCVAVLVNGGARLDVGLGRNEIIGQAIGHDSPDLLEALRPNLAELRLPPHALLAAAVRGSLVAMGWLINQGLSPLEEVRPGISVLRYVVQVTGDVNAISKSLALLLHRAVEEGLGSADIQRLWVEAGTSAFKDPVRKAIRQSMVHASAVDALREIDQHIAQTARHTERAVTRP